MGLDELRKQIDAVDKELVALLNRRAEIVVDIGKLKNTDGSPIYAPDREKAVLDKIRQANKGPLPDKTLLAIYREWLPDSGYRGNGLGDIERYDERWVADSEDSVFEYWCGIKPKA